MKKIITKNKKIVIIVLSIIVIISLFILIINLNTKTKTNESEMNKQFNAVKLVKSYVSNNSNIINYAKKNNKNIIYIKEFKSIFKINISKFNKLSYKCNSDTSYIKFNDDYSDYTIYLDCQEFYKK